MPAEADRLRAALKSWFGFDRFRPGQRAVVEDALAGRDLLAIMPTGGGKSLCFQLPALLRPGVMVVVSPLIALMQDQVRLLRDNGIAAAFLNSSLSARESSDTAAGLLRGDFKLLYLAPERLLMPDFLEGFLPRLREAQGLSGFTIDEAHCVSEWGHDFRPEYRQMHALRDHFPDVPVFAFTATATGRVRDDICHALGLRAPQRHVASFNRPNLHYAVRAKSGRSYAELLDRARQRPNDSGIIYCLSRKRVDELAASLANDGLRVLPYHAGLDAQTRRDNQDAFIRDDVQLIVATIAFGMGINKPDVRWVVHYDLPRTMEGYYQEAGRAGRDGLPADCLLYFGIGDIRTAEFLIAQKVDPGSGEPLEAEQRLARQQLRKVLDYAESTECRRAIQLRYFGESFLPPCGACDNCLDPKPMQDWTLEARQFLSAIARLAQRGERFGAAYIIDLLRGGETQKLIDRGHQSLSVYGIGKQRSQDEWRLLVRALLHQGLVDETGDGYPVLCLNEASRAVLKGTLPVVFAVAAKAEGGRRKRPLNVDDTRVLPEAEALFEALRALRKQLADTQGVPPYVVFSDASLKAMAEQQPMTADAFMQVSGVGSRKLAQYGEAFTTAIRTFRAAKGLPVPEAPASRAAFAAAEDSTAAAEEPLADTVRLTLALFERGLDAAQIAAERGLDANTIGGHLETLLARAAIRDPSRLFAPGALEAMQQALAQHGGSRLKPAWEALGGRFSYDELRLARGWLEGAARRSQTLD